MASEYLLTEVLALLAFTLVVYSTLYSWMRRRNYPPGPLGVPFVGYAPFLGEKPYETLRDLSKKYGDILSFYMGQQLIISINNHNLAKEILCLPNALHRQGITVFSGDGGFTGLKGRAWQEQRRFTLQTLKDLGLGKGLWEMMMQEEASEFVQNLLKYDGKAVFFSDHLELFYIRSMLSLLFGRPWDPMKEKDSLAKILGFPKHVQDHLTSLSSSITSPIIKKISRILLGFGVKNFMYHIRQYESTFKREVERRLQSKEELTKPDFIGRYLQEIEKRKNDATPSSFTVEHLKGILVLMSLPNPVNLVGWLFLLMAEYPDVQQKVFGEIDQFADKNQTVYFEDKLRMPYTMATIMEMMRWISANYFYSSRCVLETFQFHGYTIPKGSNIVCSAWGMMHDSRYFEDPMEFRPERFLTEDGTKVKKIDAFAPFSFGKRNCPGERVVYMTLFIYFVCVMQKFTIKKCDKQPLDFSYKFSATANPRRQQLCFVAR